MAKTQSRTATPKTHQQPPRAPEPSTPAPRTLTPAESALLDACFAGSSIAQAKAAVILERIDPKLAEAFVAARVSELRAMRERARAWEALIGNAKGAEAELVYETYYAEATERFEEEVVRDRPEFPTNPGEFRSTQQAVARVEQKKGSLFNEREIAEQDEVDERFRKAAQERIAGIESPATERAHATGNTLPATRY